MNEYPKCFAFNRDLKFNPRIIAFYFHKEFCFLIKAILKLNRNCNCWHAFIYQSIWCYCNGHVFTSRDVQFEQRVFRSCQPQIIKCDQMFNDISPHLKQNESTFYIK